MNYVTIGIALIILGFLVLIIGSLLNLGSSGSSSGEGELKGGGVILIGPIPIGFGTDRTSMIVVMAIAVILMLITYAVMSRLH